MKMNSKSQPKAKNWFQFFATPQSLWAIAATAVLSACATTKQPDEGKIIMSPSSNEIHARYEATPPIQEGESLQITRKVCKTEYAESPHGARRVEKCSKEDIGKALVVRTYNDRDFVMKVDAGVKTQEGDFVRRESAPEQKKEASVE